MDSNRDIWIGIGGLVLSVSLVVGFGYGAYKLGRYYERRDLTEALRENVSVAYYDGFGDGSFKGHKEGYAEAYTKYGECDDGGRR